MGSEMCIRDRQNTVLTHQGRSRRTADTFTSKRMETGLMGRCKLECPDGETECCICCTKQDSCQCRCDDMDSYEYAEECEDYEID